MANIDSLSRTLRQLPPLLLCGTPLLAFISFASLTAYRDMEAYDEWRILQIILLLLLGTYSLFISNNDTVLTKKGNYLIKWGLPTLLILIMFSVWHAQYVERAAADAALYSLLAICVWTQANLFRKNIFFAPKIAALLAILPLLTLIFMPISLIADASGAGHRDWHQLFSNIRIFDDALLPCIFLLWQRPAWLAIRKPTHSLSNITVTTLVWLISTMYFMALWLDGSRANLLSILIGLVLISVLRRDQFKQLRLPAFTFIGAGLLYAVLTHIFPDMIVDTIARTDSSLRSQLWSYALQSWKMHPLLGSGGDSFALSQPWRLFAHPHNITLQFISEWGLAGLLAIILLIPLAIQIFRQRHTLPAFALASIAAVCINASMSGALVYPLSQTLGLWSLAWIISLLPRQPTQMAQHYSPHGNTKKHQAKLSAHSWQLSFKIMTILALLAMLSIHGRDITCINCSSIDSENAPRFWQHGRALHLESNDSRIIVTQ